MAAVGADLSSQELLPFAARFVGVRAGAAWVQGAEAEVRDDADEPYVLLSLSLGPPPAGAATWSTDDMFELRQEVRRRLAASGVRGVVVSYVGGAADDEEQDELAGDGKGRPSDGSAVG